MKKRSGGTNNDGRTPAEQSEYDKMKMSTRIGQNDTNPMLDFIKKGIKSQTKKPLKKGETFKVMGGSPNMAKRMALKKKMGK